MISTKKYLKNLDKKQISKLINATELDYFEKWILTYTFVEKRLIENICMRLNIGRTKYFYVLKEALIKIEYKIKEFDKIRTF